MKIHYHSDHLGSASFVTDIGGYVVQHLQYLPYGELFVSQRNTEEFDSRYKFTAKELDNETSYTYFGARYYDSELSGWLSVDQLSDKYPSLSPYCYTADNPVVLVDPNGMFIGDFYDQNGKYLGTDGIDDKKVYVVTNPNEIKQIKETNRQGSTTNVNDLKSIVELPSKAIRSQMMQIINKNNPFREYGGIFGMDLEGKERVIWAKSGPQVDPNNQTFGSIDVFDTANPEEKNIISIILGTFHSHGAEKQKINTDPWSFGVTSYGGESKNLFHLDPEPTDADINNALNRSSIIKGNNYVFGMYNNTVYIYNGSGVIATFPMEKFGTVGD